VGSRLTALPSANRMYIYLMNYLTSGWVAFDDVDVRLISGGQPVGNNLAANPGFESSSDWTETREPAHPGTAFFRNNWGTASPHGGSYAYVINNHAYGYINSSLMPSILPNQQYEVRAWLRGELDTEDSEAGG
jgi:hypothetical protein